MKTDTQKNMGLIYTVTNTIISLITAIAYIIYEGSHADTMVYSDMFSVIGGLLTSIAIGVIVSIYTTKVFSINMMWSIITIPLYPAVYIVLAIIHANIAG